MTPNKISKDETLSLKSLVNEKVEILQKKYIQILILKKNMQEVLIQSNRSGVERIIDNILTNACKYNKKKKVVFISQ